MHILALLLARSGSKSVSHKNIRPILGKPLLAYSIEHALTSRLITRTIVSTDSPEYAAIAESYGAETPFLRPADISGDLSTDLEAFNHALNWLKENEDYVPNVCVHLRPTCPIRRVEDIDKMIEILMADESLDSVRSVALAPETPFKMWFRASDGILSPVVPSELKDPYNLARQALPQTFLQTGTIDVLRSTTVTKKHSMTGDRIFGYVIEDYVDIDTERDFQEAVQRLETNTEQDPPAAVSSINELGEKKTFCFDCDGVIATIVPNLQYELAQPIQETVDIINRLHASGHRILIFTARGSVTAKDWSTVTRDQLREWGVKYDELLFGKPAADYYIDDKFVDMKYLERLVLARDADTYEKEMEE